MRLLTNEEIESLACQHHDYACGRQIGESVIAEHCFDAAGLVAFVRAVETAILQRSVLPAYPQEAEPDGRLWVGSGDSQ